MGLGLAIVNTIVVEHDGAISVKDNHPCGACFTITLPVDREAGASAPIRA
jgi:K+-sensing histidine kinase KdpD